MEEGESLTPLLSPALLVTPTYIADMYKNVGRIWNALFRVQLVVGF